MSKLDPQVAQERIHEMLSILQQIVTGTVKQLNFQFMSCQLIDPNLTFKLSCGGVA